jgi:hypothetical protein
MWAIFLAPPAVAVFFEDLPVIEAEVYPIRDAFVYESQVRMVIIKMSAVVAEPEFLLKCTFSVFVNIKIGTRRAPVLKTLVIESPAGWGKKLLTNYY